MFFGIVKIETNIKTSVTRSRLVFYEQDFSLKIKTFFINLLSGIHEIPRDRVVVLKTVSLDSLGHCRLAEKSLSCRG